MNYLPRAIAMLLSALLSQGAHAQLRITGSGFIPDPDGYRSDDPPPAQRPSPTPGQTIKDCADCPEMVVLPAGSFEMGSGAAEQALANAAGVPESVTRRENPQHRVNIRSFAAGRYAISKGEFAAFVRARGYQTEAERGDGCFAWNGREFKKYAAYNWRNVGFAQADNHPVVCVSWNDAQAYIAWLNQISGQTYRLLSEAEREYAARGGSQAAFWWGDSISTTQANYSGTGPSHNGSPRGQYRQSTLPVNSFSPNPFGLYNVHGNVYEWVEDCWHDNYNGAPTDGSAWVTACSNNARVARGSSWWNFPSYLRSAGRERETPELRGSGNIGGLRLARQIDQSDLAPPGAASQSATEAAAFEAAVKLAVERVLAEVAQKAAAERAASEAAPKPTPLRTSNPPNSGQTIKDCADCPEMVVLPAGSFEMGSNEDPSERPVHRVNVPSFLIGKTEVTQGQWNAVMGSNPSRFSQCGGDCPVEQVDWNDAQEFAQRLSQKTGKQYRLPSEAEWEYAARAGSNAKWSFGDAEYQLGDHAWYIGNSKPWFGEAKTQRVAQKKPNAFGLFDMHGNVWEWVQDCWHDSYAGAPADGSAWTTGCSGNYRALRGGAWILGPAGLRSANRYRNTPLYRVDIIGFRLARTP